MQIICINKDMANHFENNPPSQLPASESPSNDRIYVRGYLGSSWSDRLAGMTITTAGGKNSEQTTLLEGHLTNKAALS
jgi:hypothetical protein